MTPTHGLQPVLWLKGTFLTPQHLQAQDRYFERRLAFQRSAFHGSPWGWLSLGIDEELLASGTIQLTVARGLFPDGLALDSPRQGPLPGARSIEGQLAPGQESVDVYLAVPDERPFERNVTTDPGSARARFLALPVTLADEAEPSISRPVQVGASNLRLLFEGEHREGYTCLEAMRVRRSAAGVFSLDPAFIPPLLRVSAQPRLVATLRALLEEIQVRSASLAGLRRQKNINLAEFTAGDIAQFWLLHTLNSVYPGLRHLVETVDGHPEEVAGSLLELAGMLLTFSPKLAQADLPSYDHRDLGGVFGTLLAIIGELLATVVPSNFQSFPLRLMQSSVYGTALDDPKVFSAAHYYLALQAEVEAAELIVKAPQLVKVCSAQHIEHLVRQALPGAPLLHQPQPPVAIPVKLGHQYFRIDPSGLAWEAVTRSRTLAAYIPGDLPRPKCELIVVWDEPAVAPA